MKKQILGVAACAAMLVGFQNCEPTVVSACASDRQAGAGKGACIIETQGDASGRVLGDIDVASISNIGYSRLANGYYGPGGAPWSGTGWVRLDHTRRTITVSAPNGNVPVPLPVDVNEESPGQANASMMPPEQHVPQLSGSVCQMTYGSADYDAVVRALRAARIEPTTDAIMADQADVFLGVSYVEAGSATSRYREFVFAPNDSHLGLSIVDAPELNGLLATYAMTACAVY